MDALEKDVPCAFCGHSVVGAQFLVCSQCDVPIHADCWSVSGKCPAYACGSTSGLDPAVALYRKVRTDLVVSQSKQLASLPHNGDDDLPEKIRLLEKHIFVVSLSAAKQFSVMMAGILILTIALVAWPNSFLAYIIPPLVVLWTGAIALRSRPENEKHRVLRRKLDDLRSRQIEQQIDHEVRIDRGDPKS